MDLRAHFENRNRVPPDELAPYYGRLVAWNLEGTKIIATGEDDTQILALARTAGYGPDDCVIAYLPHPDEVLFGGFWCQTKVPE